MLKLLISFITFCLLLNKLVYAACGTGMTCSVVDGCYDGVTNLGTSFNNPSLDWCIADCSEQIEDQIYNPVPDTVLNMLTIGGSITNCNVSSNTLSWQTAGKFNPSFDPLVMTISNDMEMTYLGYFDNAAISVVGTNPVLSVGGDIIISNTITSKGNAWDTSFWDLELISTSAPSSFICAENGQGATFGNAFECDGFNFDFSNGCDLDFSTITDVSTLSFNDCSFDISTSSTLILPTTGTWAGIPATGTNTWLFDGGDLSAGSLAGMTFPSTVTSFTVQNSGSATFSTGVSFSTDVFVLTGGSLTFADGPTFNNDFTIDGSSSSISVTSGSPSFTNLTLQDSADYSIPGIGVVQGHITVANSYLSVTSTVSPSGVEVKDQSTLYLESAPILTTSFVNCSSSRIVGEGTIEGELRLGNDCEVMLQDSTDSNDNSVPSILTIDGLSVMGTNSSLTFKITSSTQYDSLIINGDIHLDQNINLYLNFTGVYGSLLEIDLISFSGSLYQSNTFFTARSIGEDIYSENAPNLSVRITGNNTIQIYEDFGCLGASNGTSCNTGLACSTNDTCMGGVCTAGTPIICEASNECTLPGVCVEPTGCSLIPVSSGVACNDGDPCSTNDECDGTGRCVGIQKFCGDSDGCTDEFCDFNTGECVYSPSLGVFGPNCTQLCSQNCPTDNNICSQSTGFCGPCENGFHGESCSLPCPSLCPMSCEQDTGFCFLECPVGQFQVAAEMCDDCEAGTYKDFIGRETCLSCPENCDSDQCESRTGYCFSCDSGYFGKFCEQSCGPGLFLNGTFFLNTTTFSCESCPVGTFSTAGFGCQPCPPGRSSLPGSAECSISNTVFFVLPIGILSIVGAAGSFFWYSTNKGYQVVEAVEPWEDFHSVGMGRFKRALNYVVVFADVLQISAFGFGTPKLWNDQESSLIDTNRVITWIRTSIGDIDLSFFDVAWYVPIIAAITLAYLYLLFALPFILTSKGRSSCQSIRYYIFWLIGGLGFIPITRNIIAIYDCTNYVLDSEPDQICGGTNYWSIVVVATLALLAFFSSVTIGQILFQQYAFDSVDVRYKPKYLLGSLGIKVLLATCNILLTSFTRTLAWITLISTIFLLCLALFPAVCNYPRVRYWRAAGYVLALVPCTFGVAFSYGAKISEPIILAFLLWVCLLFLIAFILYEFLLPSRPGQSNSNSSRRFNILSRHPDLAKLENRVSQLKDNVLKQEANQKLDALIVATDQSEKDLRKLKWASKWKSYSNFPFSKFETSYQTQKEVASDLKDSLTAYLQPARSEDKIDNKEDKASDQHAISEDGKGDKVSDKPLDDDNEKDTSLNVSNVVLNAADVVKKETT